MPRVLDYFGYQLRAGGNILYITRRRKFCGGRVIAIRATGNGAAQLIARLEGSRAHEVIDPEYATVRVPWWSRRKPWRAK